MHLPDGRVIHLADGRRLGFDDLGTPTGRPVIYMHGGTTSRLTARLAAADAAELGIRLIAPDRPGIGLSDPQPGRTLSDWADDVRALADMLGLDQYGVIGVSEGTPYALACASANPERVGGVSIAGPIAALRNPLITRAIHPPVRLMVSLAVYTPWLLRLAFAAMHADVRHRGLRAVAGTRRAFPPADQHLFAEYAGLEMRLDDLRSTFAWGARWPAYDFALAAREWDFQLDAIHCPVWVFQGDADTIHTLAMVRHLVERIPGARLTILHVPGTLWTLTHLKPALAKFTRCA